MGSLLYAIDGTHIPILLVAMWMLMLTEKVITV